MSGVQAAEKAGDVLGLVVEVRKRPAVTVGLGDHLIGSVLRVGDDVIAGHADHRDALIGEVPTERGSRELARAIFDWFCDEASTDLHAVRAMVESYLSEGGPGRITEPADFSMLLAHRLNFLLDQARLALDPLTEPRHREWAEREIDELPRIMPTPHQLADVLAGTRDCVQAIPR